MRARVDTLIVGAGQAGLSAAFALRDLGVTSIIYERNPRVGDSWRQRYESLVLFSSRECSALPGFAHTGDPNGFPDRQEIADYLEAYATKTGLGVVTGDGIAMLSRSEGSFLAVTDTGNQLEARAVVIATGAFQRPHIPSFAANLSDRVLQLTATTYRNPSALPANDVIVVGDGATGRQIALELATTRRVALATGKRRHIVPQRVFGKDSMWWFDRLGILRADKESLVGRIVRSQDAFPGWHMRSSALKRAGITLLPRCIGARGDELELADGSRRTCDAVIWALGYRDETEWVRIEGAVTDGSFAHERGITPIPGLFHVGRDWQNSRASALICGVAGDATKIAGHVVRYLNEPRSELAPRAAALDTRQRDRRVV